MSIETETVGEKVEDVKKEEKKDETKEEKIQKEDTKKKEGVQPKPLVHKVDYESDVVYLYQLSRTPVIPSVSPFCLKVEAWLRFAGIKYENVDHKMRYRSKKGQLPFVEVNGEEVADSCIVIQELAKRYNYDMDDFLNSEQRLRAHTAKSMIENHLHWVVESWRCKNPGRFLKGSKLNCQHAYGRKVPNTVLNICVKLRYKLCTSKKVRAHGLGVHSSEEIEEFGKKDLQVLSDMLGDKNYYFGDQPSLLDVTSFAFLAQISCMDKDTPYALREWMAAQTPNLVEHINRIKEKVFPDWDEMLSTLEMNTHLPKPPPEEEKKDEEKDKEDAKEEPKKETEVEASKEENKE